MVSSNAIIAVKSLKIAIKVVSTAKNKDLGILSAIFVLHPNNINIFKTMNWQWKPYQTNQTKFIQNFNYLKVSTSRPVILNNQKKMSLTYILVK